MTDDMSQFYEVFFDEAEELLAEAEQLLLDIDVDDPDFEDLNAIFRAAHSIKGGAATFGFMDMAEITHVLENLLDKIRKQEMDITAEHVDAFLSAKDVLDMELDGHRNDAEVDQDQVTAVQETLKMLSEGATEAAKTESTEQAATTVEPAPVESVPEQTAAPTTTATASLTDEEAQKGLQLFNVALPELTEKDLANIQEEIGLLGDVVEAKKVNGEDVFVVKTDSSEDDIVSICSFIVDPDELTITLINAADAVPNETPESTAVDAAPVAQNETKQSDESKDTATAQKDNDDDKTQVFGESGFGLFETDDKEAEEQGYGFFAPIEPQPDAPKEQLIDDNTDLTAENAGVEATASDEVVEAKKDKSKEKKASKKADKAASENSSIRVGVEKVDQLINLVGELVITQAMIEQRVNHLDPVDHETLINSVGQLTRNTRDLQESVMSIRMMPMDFVFSRFPRMVRDLAGKLDKKIEFETVGATTELDKGLIERIVDPLTHLVRNSVDHGIETPAKRIAAGKSEKGVLTLSAAHKGGSIVIEVTDDGAGLDRNKILAKAQSNGLTVSESMTDSEVFGLIFAAGFSTAEKVTDVSGRGVGMDVVKRNIASMGGKVEIRSALGFGTTISIALPLTLAILDGMSVSLGSNLYVIPLNLIVETLQPRVEDIKTITGEGRMVHVRGEYLPIIPLHSLFSAPTKITDPEDGVLVIIESDGKKSALLIDRLVGQQQVVIKSLETNYRKIKGVSGATIMGDGSVALIIDVPAIIEMGQTTNYVTGGAAFSNQDYLASSTVNA